MTRAYLRLDPRYDERKADYPDGPYAAFIACLCLGESQPERGRFRSVRFLRALLDRRGRHVKYLLEHGDLVELADGRVYIEGWDEWQEGDWKVTERVQRIRSRRASDRDKESPDVTAPGTPDVTVHETADRLSRDSLGIDSGRRSGAVGAGADGQPSPPGARAAGSINPRDGLPHITEAVQIAGEGITGRGILTAGDRQLTELDRLVEAHGEHLVVDAFRAVANGGTKSWRQLVWDSMKRLEPLSGPASARDAAQAEKDQVAASFRRPADA